MRMPSQSNVIANDSGLGEFDNFLLDTIVPRDLLGSAAELDVPDRVVEASSSSRIQDSSPGPGVYSSKFGEFEGKIQKIYGSGLKKMLSLPRIKTSRDRI